MTSTQGGTDHSGEQRDGEAVNEQIEHFEASASALPGETVSQQETGHEVVDTVLRSLDGLEGRPVSEHVAVFEAAHERLRGALARAGEVADRPGGPTPR